MTSNVQQNSRGILLVILAMSVFSIQDVLIKFISSNVSLFQILFYRSVIGALLIIIFQRAIGQTIRLWTAYPALSLLRGVFFFFGYSAFYFAQSKMPIANATVLFLVSPFFITILSKMELDGKRMQMIENLTGEHPHCILGHSRKQRVSHLIQD